MSVTTGPIGLAGPGAPILLAPLRVTTSDAGMGIIARLLALPLAAMTPSGRDERHGEHVHRRVHMGTALIRPGREAGGSRGGRRSPSRL